MNSELLDEYTRIVKLFQMTVSDGIIDRAGFLELKRLSDKQEELRQILVQQKIGA